VLSNRQLVCLFCNCYFVCVQVWVFLFVYVVVEIGGRVLTFVAYASASWLGSYVHFRTAVRV
jgi:apolipoprotein N-acyltransferase